MKCARLSITALALMTLAGCSTSEPELPPPPPGSVLTTVTANSRDRDINGLRTRDALANETIEPCPDEGQVRNADGVCEDVVR